MDVLEQICGTWRLSREIEDHLAGKRLVFEGRADLSPDDRGLIYVEHGRWTQSDWGNMAASRKLLWRSEGGRIRVEYEDGRPFHDFELVSNGTREGGHDCAPDRYDVTYRFRLPDLWEADWRVKGPQKNYTSRTRYDRETE